MVTSFLVVPREKLPRNWCSNGNGDHKKVSVGIRREEVREGERGGPTSEVSTAINKSGERGYSALNILPGLSGAGGLLPS